VLRPVSVAIHVLLKKKKTRLKDVNLVSLHPSAAKKRLLKGVNLVCSLV
jgi:hypothetical protein